MNTTLFPADTAVLIVDDNPQFAGLLQRLLQSSWGFTTVDIETSPEAAVSRLLAGESHYSIFFIDFHFPEELNGCDVLLKLKQQGILEKRFAFLITSEPTGENIQRAMEAGAIGVVGKPFNREDLERQLTKAARLIELSDKEGFTVDES